MRRGTLCSGVGSRSGLRGSVGVPAIPTRRVWDALLMRVLFSEVRLAFLGRYARFGRELCTSGKWILDSNCTVATFCGLSMCKRFVPLLIVSS